MVKDGGWKINRGLMSILPIQGKVQYNRADGKLELMEEKRSRLIDDFSDECFAFIAGHTEGGAPYGITWEELGLKPYASEEELMEAYECMEINGDLDNKIDGMKK